jgi:hypothetical protein
MLLGFWARLQKKGVVVVGILIVGYKPSCVWACEPSPGLKSSSLGQPVAYVLSPLCERLLGIRWVLIRPRPELQHHHHLLQRLTQRGIDRAPGLCCPTTTTSGGLLRLLVVPVEAHILAAEGGVGGLACIFACLGPLASLLMSGPSPNSEASLKAGRIKRHQVSVQCHPPPPPTPHPPPPLVPQIWSAAGGTLSVSQSVVEMTSAQGAQVVLLSGGNVSMTQSRFQCPPSSNMNDAYGGVFGSKSYPLIFGPDWCVYFSPPSLPHLLGSECRGVACLCASTATWAIFVNVGVVLSYFSPLPTRPTLSVATWSARCSSSAPCVPPTPSLFKEATLMASPTPLSLLTAFPVSGSTLPPPSPPPPPCSAVRPCSWCRSVVLASHLPPTRMLILNLFHCSG